MTPDSASYAWGRRADPPRTVLELNIGVTVRSTGKCPVFVLSTCTADLRPEFFVIRADRGLGIREQEISVCTTYNRRPIPIDAGASMHATLPVRLYRSEAGSVFADLTGEFAVRLIVQRDPTTDGAGRPLPLEDVTSAPFQVQIH